MKRIINILAAATLYATLYAIPAKQGPIELIQADGSTVIVYQHGDERFHYMTLEDGTWVQQNAQGLIERTEELSTVQITQQRRQSARYNVATQTQKAYPLNIAPKGLVILISFSDLEFTTDKAEIDSMLNGQHYTRDYEYTSRGQTHRIISEGSARQYFIDQSGGKYKPQFDVVGPVKVSKNMAYYGQNDKSGNDTYAEDLLVEACILAHGQLNVDFSQYDCDNDGEIDFVYMLYAGFGEANGGGANTIWPHSFALKDYYYKSTRLGGRGQAKVTLNGKLLNWYACSNEFDYVSKVHDGIGTFCHEFGHVLGLPDMYDINGKLYALGNWDIMDGGSYNNEGNTPAAYSAYERFFMGWAKPAILNKACSVTLKDLKETKGFALISSTGTHNLIGNDPNPTEFYLLENRQKESWDAYLPGHGMLITKITYNYNKWASNDVNTSASSMGIDLIKADGKATKSGDATDAFPAGAMDYTPYAKYPITHIQENEGVITFDFMGGGEEIIPDAIEEVSDEEERVIGIYNIFGQAQGSTDIRTLAPELYIVKTTCGTKKIHITK